MSALEELIKGEITQSGPMRLDDYMARCLSHPQYGYYMKKDPLGAAGDFTTSPEISQLFGEMVGLFLLNEWHMQGKPRKFLLAELGPGRGSLMADLLRATQIDPEFEQAADIFMIETSPTLRLIQQKTLATHDISWAEEIAELPDLPLFLVANEFFDALPVRQFCKMGNGWAERKIALADGALEFIWGLSPVALNQELDTYFGPAEMGMIFAKSEASLAIMAALSAQIGQCGGSGLLIDYGAWDGMGDTLQALRQHQFVSPLETPGEADLTLHVNFSQLAACAPATVKLSRTINQRDFLRACGIETRLQKLISRPESSDQARKMLLEGYNRLTSGEEMGTLFKVMSVIPNHAPDNLLFPS